MLPTAVAIIAIITVAVLWTISIQRRLKALDEHINSAMSQIVVQLASRSDSLASLLGAEILPTKYRVTATSTPDDVLRLEEAISEALRRISIVTELSPDFKADEKYIRAMDAAKTFGKMVRTSKLIYNDGVAKLNREIRTFPTSIVAGALGYRQRDYLEDLNKTNQNLLI